MPSWGCPFFVNSSRSLFCEMIRFSSSLLAWLLAFPTENPSCTAVPLRLIESSVVTAIPTDVNWPVLLFLYVLSCELDGRLRSYTPDRELSDAMSALLYNLDNIIALDAEAKSAAVGTLEGQREGKHTRRCEGYCV